MELTPKMEQDIIEAPYSDNHLPTQVVTIVLPSVPHNQNVQPTYTTDVHSLTPLQPNETTNQLINDNITTATTINDITTTTSITTTTLNTNSSSTNYNINDNTIQINLLENASSLNTIKVGPDVIVSSESTENRTSNDSSTHQRGSRSRTRFKWTKESAQVASNLVKHGCKPILVSVAVGCSLRTAQKFVEIVKPKMEGESFKNYEIRRRGRKSRDVNQRLEAIREVLSKDSSKTQVQIAADLKVSNTTVCRDLKRIGASWKKNDHDRSSPNKRESRKDRPLSSSSSSSPSFKNKSGGRQKKKTSKKDPENKETMKESDCN